MVFKYFKAPETSGKQKKDLKADAILKALSERLIKNYDLATAMEKLKWEGLVDLEEQRIDGLTKMLEQVREFRDSLLRTYTLDHVLDKSKNALKSILKAEIDALNLIKPIEMAEPSGDNCRVGKNNLEKISHSIEMHFPNNMTDTFMEITSILPEDGSAVQKIQSIYEDVWQKISGLYLLIPDGYGIEEAQLETALQELIHFVESGNEENPIDLALFMAKHSNTFKWYDKSGDWFDNIFKKHTALLQLLMSVSYPIRLSLEGLVNLRLKTSRLAKSIQTFWDAMDRRRPKHKLRKHHYCGNCILDLDAALVLEERIQKLDELENMIQAANIHGDISDINTDLICEMLGELAESSLQKLTRIVDVLIEGGYLQIADERYFLTSKALRRIGELALSDIFSDFHLSRTDCSQMRKNRTIHSHSGETKEYEYGDLLNLHLSSSLCNAMRRNPVCSPPISITPFDFEIYRPENISKNTTVLLIDTSSSMEDKFAKAKKVALALKQLIIHRFPGDTMKIVVFYSLARALNIKELIEIKTMPFHLGKFQKVIDYRELKEREKKGGFDFPGDFTNIQEGLRLSREILLRDKSEEKHIFLITDGEPTACSRDGMVHLECPPTATIFEETIKEVKKCTLNDINITTFMLSESETLQNFVKIVGKINKGKAFFTPPEEIDQYVVIDYLKKRSYQVR